MMPMKLGWLIMLIAFLVLIHHYHKHGRFYNPEDLKQLKFQSHEFWVVILTSLSLLLLSL